MPVKKRTINGLYLISDTAFSGGRSHGEVVLQGLRGGARVIQLRDKDLTVRELYPVALIMRELARKAGAVFIINDLVELAMAVDADGVHLGQDDMPVSVARRLLGEDRIIGISTHSLDDALAAESAGADYIGFGPMFPTGTKDSGIPKGPEGLRALREKIKVPIAAIGGINAGNARSVIEAGADALAVISAVTMADDIEKAAREIAVLFGGSVAPVKTGVQ